MIELAMLLSTFLPLSLIFWFLSVLYSSNEITQIPSPLRWLLSIFIPTMVAISGFKKKSLSLSGVIVALVIGVVLTLSNYCFTISLLIFFVTASKATKYKSEEKRRIESDFRVGGQRNWVQVVCNGGVAADLAICYLLERGSTEAPIDFIKDYNSSWFAISVLGSICCATGDTWASELGSVLSSSDPYLITTLKRVPKGTNGGVSFFGLLVSGLGGTVISLSYFITLWVCANSELYYASPAQFYPLLIIGTFSGLIGSVVDSILGATFQYSGYNTNTRKVVETPGRGVKHITGVRVLDNHSVNLLSNLITALITPYFAIQLWTYF